MHLGLLVVRLADGGMTGKEQARSARLFDCVGPLALELQDLRSMNDALAPKRHEIGLRRAPTRECFGPLLCSSRIEDLATFEQHTAVHDARDGRRDFVGDHPDHRFVQARRARGKVALRNERFSATESAEGDDIAVAELLADVAGARERRVRYGDRPR